MSRSKHVFALLPLLSLMAISPSEMESHFRSRSLASVEEVKTEKVSNPYPRVSKILKSIDKPSLDINIDQSVEEFSAKLEGLKERVSEEREAFEAKFKKIEDIKNEKERIAGKVREVAQIEADLLLNLSVEESSQPKINEIKEDLEFMLVGLAKNEKRLKPAAAKEVVAEVKPKVEVKEIKEVKEEVKEEKTEVCDHISKAGPTNPQIDQLMQNQNMMMQFLQRLMVQSMYNVPNTFNYQQAYQYQPQMGGWGYQIPQVSGLAQSIMGQPQQPQQPQAYQPLAAPSLLSPQTGSWGLTPAPLDMQMDPRLVPAPISSGNFGMDTVGFDMQPTTPAGQFLSGVPQANYQVFGMR